MNEKLTELVFIIDKSGSMSGLEKDTIGGFNSLIEKQKKEDGEAYVSTVLFDTERDVIHDRIELSEVNPMTEKDYVPCGATALLDTLGESIKHVEKIHKYIRKEDCPAKTLFIITTDGLENSSKEYSYRQVKKMIESKKESGWEFLFLGANIDAVAEAEKLGIAPSNAVKYECDEAGTSVNYEALDMAVSSARKMTAKEFKRGFMDGKWKMGIERDYEERHGR